MSRRNSLVALLKPRTEIRPVPGWQLGVGESWLLPLRWLRAYAWSLVREPTLVPWVYGLQVHLDPGTQMSRAFFLTGLFEPNQITLLDRLLEPGMTFVDIGANSGFYTLFAAQKLGVAGRVLALEPSPREFARLEANVAVNCLSNVQPLRVAAGELSGRVDLLVADDYHTGHNTLGAFGYAVTRLDHVESVDIRPLDELAAQLAIVHVDVMKLDTEGAEMKALRGAARVLEADHPLLLLEVSDRMLRLQGACARDVWALLGRLGYTVFAYDTRTGTPVVVITLRDDFEGDVVAVHSSWRHWA